MSEQDSAKTALQVAVDGLKAAQEQGGKLSKPALEASNDTACHAGDRKLRE